MTKKHLLLTLALTGLLLDAGPARADSAASLSVSTGKPCCCPTAPSAPS